MIGRMTESLIGAVGLKEFVFGTSFLSVSFKDQDPSQAAPSCSRSVSLCLTLLALFPLSPSTAHFPLLGALFLSVLFFQFLGTPHIFLSPAHQLADSRQPLSESQESSGQGYPGRASIHAVCLLWPNH